MENYDQVEILLVEDNAADAELTLRALKRQHLVNKQHRVEDGEAALDFVFRSGRYAARSASQPRLVMLDLKLPKVDGIEVLRALKTNDSSRAIPVVMLDIVRRRTRYHRELQPGREQLHREAGGFRKVHTHGRGDRVLLNTG